MYGAIALQDIQITVMLSKVAMNYVSSDCVALEGQRWQIGNPANSFWVVSSSCSNRRLASLKLSRRIAAAKRKGRGVSGAFLRERRYWFSAVVRDLRLLTT